MLYHIDPVYQPWLVICSKIARSLGLFVALCSTKALRQFLLCLLCCGPPVSLMCDAIPIHPRNPRQLSHLASDCRRAPLPFVQKTPLSLSHALLILQLALSCTTRAASSRSRSHSVHSFNRQQPVDRVDLSPRHTHFSQSVSRAARARENKSAAGVAELPKSGKRIAYR